MTKSNKKTEPPLSARKLTPVQFALLDMRHSLGLTQSGLAQRMDAALITIAKWETTRSPSGPSLAKLRNFARTNGLPGHESVFDFALRQSVLTDPQVRTISYANRAEMEAMLAARHMVRTRQTFQKALEDIRASLKESPNPEEWWHIVGMLDFAVGQSTDKSEHVLKVLTEFRRKIEENK